MKLVPASRLIYGDLKIPPGWEIQVPEVVARREDERFRALVLAFQRWGRKPLAAEELAQEACRGVFEARWITSVRAFVARAAERHIERGGSLETFDLDHIQRAYVPDFHRYIEPGRGNMFLEEALRGMR